jgi:hypothetical protein
MLTARRFFMTDTEPRDAATEAALSGRPCEPSAMASVAAVVCLESEISRYWPRYQTASGIRDFCARKQNVQK